MGMQRRRKQLNDGGTSSEVTSSSSEINLPLLVLSVVDEPPDEIGISHCFTFTMASHLFLLLE